MPGDRVYRPIQRGRGACQVCDRLFDLTRPRKMLAPRLIRAHGHPANRCPGSGRPPRRWLDAAGLPDWDDMSDLDKGAALMHVWKRFWETGPYATENYPARYFDDPLLCALSDREACRHSVQAAGYHREAQARLGNVEHMRLYDLALAADRQRTEAVDRG